MFCVEVTRWLLQRFRIIGVDLKEVSFVAWHWICTSCINYLKRSCLQKGVSEVPTWPYLALDDFILFPDLKLKGKHFRTIQNVGTFNERKTRLSQEVTLDECLLNNPHLPLPEFLCWCFSGALCIASKVWEIIENCCGTSQEILLEVVDRFWYRWHCSHKRIMKDFSLWDEVLHHWWWTFGDFMPKTVEEIYAFSSIKFGFTHKCQCVNVLLLVLGFSRSFDQGFWGVFGMWCCVSVSCTLNPWRWRQHVNS